MIRRLCYFTEMIGTLIFLGFFIVASPWVVQSQKQNPNLLETFEFIGLDTISNWKNHNPAISTLQVISLALMLFFCFMTVNLINYGAKRREILLLREQLARRVIHLINSRITENSEQSLDQDQAGNAINRSFKDSEENSGLQLSPQQP